MGYISNKLRTTFSLLLFSYCMPIYADFFTAVTELENLLLPHMKIMTNLEIYVIMQEKKLLLLNRYLNLYIRHLKNNIENGYTHNPINSFILIKRLIVDLDCLPTIVNQGAEYIPFLFMKQSNMLYPSQKDLIGAAQGVARLQRVYNLNVKDLAEGNLNNLAYTTPMTAGDCYVLSQSLVIKKKDFKAGRAWMMEAQRKYNKENVSYPFTKVVLLRMFKYLSMVNKISGNLTTVLSSARPNISEAELIKKYDQKSFNAEKLEFEKESNNETSTDIRKKYFDNYKALCRGDLVVPPIVSKRLTCRYLTENHAFLKIAPFKIEMMYLNPDLILFHDVLSDSEIETIMKICTPKLKRAKINDPKTGRLQAVNTRIGKVAWLLDTDSDVSARIERRIAHMTGLIMGLPREFQVVNYGIGGHCGSHFDFSRNEEKFAPSHGKKLATILFYMTDVAQGGATVFPELGVRLLPGKGTAAFWFNLHPSLEGDYAMLHAACPVLQGDKWGMSQHVVTKCIFFTFEWNPAENKTFQIKYKEVSKSVYKGKSLEIYADYFTAVTELEYLLLPQMRIVKNLKIYVIMQEKKLLLLNRFLNLYKRNHINNTGTGYVYNPLNVFILIKRLVIDLDYLPTIVNQGAEYMPLLLRKQIDMVYPSQKDLIGAAQGVARLQRVYNLNVKDLAEGNLNNLAYTTPMTAGDCYVLSQSLVIKKKDFKAGREWMLEAQRKYHKENVSYPFTEVDIHKYLSKVNNIPGNLTTELPSAKQTSDLNNSETELTKKHHQKIFTREKFEFDKESSNETRSEKKNYNNYEALCRGDLVVPPRISKRLTCRYLTENHAFLKIAPLKTEMVYLNPDLILFHDVLSDIEIEKIMKITKPKLKRAKINDPKTGDIRSGDTRISKVAWLMDTDSDVSVRIERRIAHMTGLKIGLPREFQVVNYGIAGYYESHFDFFTNQEKFAPSHGKKLATILFYMTDVAQGGATVFPELGVRLLPVKGTAAFWLNLHPSLEGDYAMLHAACPVLQGDKWVCSKFVDKEDQIFTRPCNLEYQEEGFINKIAHPVPKAIS